MTIGKVTNPVAELSRKYEADRLKQSTTTNVGTGVKSEDKASDHKADAKALLGNLAGEAPKKAAELKLSTESLIKQAYANAIEGVKVTKLEGAARIARIHELAEQQFNLSVSRGEALESNPKFVRRNF